MNSKTIATSAGIIEYSEHGKGLPVLVVHGGHSNCNETLCLKGFDLTKFKLIIPSRPGYGATPTGKNASVKKTAELFIALLDKLNIEKTIVYGISSGAPTAIELAAAYPERVKKLVLASAITKEWIDKSGENYKRAITRLNPKLEKFTLKITKFLAKFSHDQIMNNIFSRYTKYPLTKLEIEDKNKISNAIDIFQPKEGFINDLKQTIEVEPLNKISCPTLIIHSNNDNNVPISHAVHASKNIKNSVLRILNNQWGHMIWVGKDSETGIKRIIEFIEK